MVCECYSLISYFGDLWNTIHDNLYVEYWWKLRAILHGEKREMSTLNSWRSIGGATRSVLMIGLVLLAFFYFQQNRRTPSLAVWTEGVNAKTAIRHRLLVPPGHQWSSFALFNSLFYPSMLLTVTLAGFETQTGEVHLVTTSTMMMMMMMMMMMILFTPGTLSLRYICLPMITFAMSNWRVMTTWSYQ